MCVVILFDDIISVLYSVVGVSVNGVLLCCSVVSMLNLFGCML